MGRTIEFKLAIAGSNYHCKKDELPDNETCCRCGYLFHTYEFTSL